MNKTYVEQWCFDNFSEFLDLFLATTNITVGYIWLIFNLHHSNGWIDFWWQWYVNLIFIPVHTIFKEKKRTITKIVSSWSTTNLNQFNWWAWRIPNTHSFFNICGCNWISQINHKFGKLLNIDNIFWIIGICINDLSASSNLQWLLICQCLFVRCQIP